MRLAIFKRWLFWILTALIVFSSLVYAVTKNPAPIRLAPSRVGLVQSDTGAAADIGYDEIRAMIREAVRLSGGLTDILKDNLTVVIKPNLVGMTDSCLPNWGGRPLATEVNGVTTDWRVTKAVVELVREYNPHGKVYVMEGSGSATKPIMEHLLYTPDHIPGVDEFLAIEEDSGGWRDFESPGMAKVNLPKGLIHQSYYLNRKYYEADVVISLPTMKNHWHAAVTGGIKNVAIGATPANVYGASAYNPIRLNMFNHESEEIHRWIHDFYLCRPVNYVIMDGLQGIQNGPTPSYEMSRTTDIKQDQMNMRLILAGRDPIAVDTIESLVIGWDPQSVGYLRYLNQSKAGYLDPACINVAGKPVALVRKYFAGVIPPGGGARIEDKTPPELTVKKAQLAKNTLKLNLETAPETVKVEVYLNGQLQEPAFTKNFGAIKLKIPGAGNPAPSEPLQVQVRAYDRFLNESVQDLTVVPDPKGLNGTAGSIIPDGSYLAPQAATAPVIDGLGNDPCWEKAPWRDIKYLWLYDLPTPTDFRGRYKILWTPEQLYYLVEITDDVLSDVHPDPLVDYYKDDCLELFLDEDHSGGEHTYNYNAFAYHISLTYDIVDTGTNRLPRLFNDHAQIRRTKHGNVYLWEIALKVFSDAYDEQSTQNRPVTLAPGKTLGFAIAYCDNDGGADRETFMGSMDIPWPDKNVAYQTASVFGTLTLGK